MTHRKSIVLGVLLLIAAQAFAQDRGQPSAREQERIIREVRHELVMLPYFGVFDNIAFKAEGDTVTLLGQVVRPSLKSDAGNAVKHIEGVEHVDNQIEVLPLSPIDDRLRLQLYRAIYGYPALEKYALGVQKTDSDHRQEWPCHARRSSRQRWRQELRRHSRQRRPRKFLGDQ